MQCNENYYKKFENFQRQLSFKDISVKYLEKNSIYFMALLHSFLQYQFDTKSKASNKRSIGI